MHSKLATNIIDGYFGYCLFLSNYLNGESIDNHKLSRDWNVILLVFTSKSEYFIFFTQKVPCSLSKLKNLNCNFDTLSPEKAQFSSQ